MTCSYITPAGGDPQSILPARQTAVRLWEAILHDYENYRAAPYELRQHIDPVIPVLARVGGDDEPSDDELADILASASQPATRLARAGYLPSLAAKRSTPRWEARYRRQGPEAMDDLEDAVEARRWPNSTAGIEAELQRLHRQNLENASLNDEDASPDDDLEADRRETPVKRHFEREHFPRRPNQPPPIYWEHRPPPTGKPRRGQKLTPPSKPRVRAVVDLKKVFEPEYRDLLDNMRAVSETTSRKHLYDIQQQARHYIDEVWLYCNEEMQFESDDPVRHAELQSRLDSNWNWVEPWRSAPSGLYLWRFHWQYDIWDSPEGQHFTAILDGKRKNSRRDQERHRQRARDQWANTAQRTRKQRAQKTYRSLAEAKAKDAERKRTQSPEAKAKEAERKRAARAAMSPDDKAREAERKRAARAKKTPS